VEHRLREDIDRLKQMLLEMAARVEVNIGAAVEGLRQRDGALLEDVVKRDTEVDLLELQVDEACIALIALHQPVGRDLRLVATALKIVKDIERMGDIAKSIAKHGINLIQEAPLPFPPDMGRMATRAQDLLRQALDAFVTQDAGLARQVLVGDDEVDQCHRENVRYIVKAMVANPEVVPPWSQYLSVNKFLERIGDHSGNIAAMVVYLVEGRDIRHLKKQLRRSAETAG